MNDITSLCIDCMCRGALGAALIIFGLIGLQRNKRVKPIPRPPKRKRRQRGFIIAPLLYILTLIGVASGILFSNYMQSARSVSTVQNNIQVKTELQQAAQTIAASAVLGTDAMTICPPRSGQLPNTDPCYIAPIGMRLFSELSVSEIARLPANYNFAASGSPAEVGILAPGSGVKQLDPYGHYYIYCRFENSRASPSAQAFTLISGGPDGTIQTTCGATVPIGDDVIAALSVGAAINRAAVWQADTSNNVSYGAIGSKVTVDALGDITAAGYINALSAAITNGITASSVTTTGDITGVNLTGSGNVSGAAGSFGTLNVSGISNLASLEATTGSFAGALGVGGTLNVTGASTLTALSATTGAFSGALTAPNITTTGVANIGGMLNVTGISSLAALTATSGAFSGALTALTITTTGNVTVGGTLTAANFNLSGTANGTIANFTDLTVTSLTDTGFLTVAGVSTLAGLTATTGAFSSTLTAASITSTGAASIGGTLGVTGATLLSSLSTSGNVGIGTTSPHAPLDVYGSIDVKGLNAITYPGVDTTSGGSIGIGNGALANIGVTSVAYGDTAVGYNALNGNLTLNRY